MNGMEEVFLRNAPYSTSGRRICEMIQLRVV